MDPIREQSDKVIICESWLIPVARDSVYAIASDFAQMPKHFPKIAHSVEVVALKGNHLTIEAQAASFGRYFPKASITIEAELLPGRGYKASTFNRTFNTRGDEQLLLSDADNGTKIEYTYIVTVKQRWLRPLYGWLVRKFALSYWKRSYLEPLTRLAQAHQRAAQSNNQA